MYFTDKGVYHLVVVDGKKAGIVGYIPLSNSSAAGFVQVVIIPKFRGRGLSGIAENLLAEKYGLKKLYATIKKSNLSSIRAHIKNGFKTVGANRMAILRKKKLLKKDEVRLIKKYMPKKLILNFKQKVERAIDKIRPALKADGGDIKLVSASEKTGVVKVELLGMCSHCPMASITLKQGVEAELKKKVNGVKEVEAV